MGRRAWYIACGVIVAVLLTGCVERTLTITSDPAGALVWVSDVEAGRTPLTVPFTWYGDYEIILRYQDEEGGEYRSLTTNAHLLPPWYEIPPLDLLSELAPWTYRDRRYLHYRLEPVGAVDPDDIIRRAGELRQRTLEEVR